ncbi:class I SAM-dependent methyltransferase [Amycolatopsis nigrescens]|uniref:class I SAM-dependent methyltransferase n=1 Tax=Amycolatopsis nigrescens TaxID=381445 RepID=UPI00068910B5|nr:class I SAM-dependent methyltransferase [Amycolatopsis nigrescens]
MVNSYAGLSRYYDLIMTSGYYDYDDYVRALIASLGERRRVLELGVGTGLVCQRLLESAPELRITGIDHTESMLAQARERLGHRVNLVRQDILRMTISAAFEAAFSVGGVWCHLEDGDGLTLASHLVDDRDNVTALTNLHRALAPGSLFLLAVQQSHRTFQRELPGGLTYDQQVRAVTDDLLVKDYYVIRDGDVLAHQRCQFRTFPEDEGRRLLEKCGFGFKEASENGMLQVYVRQA